jgi:hypothetical protein
VLDGPVNLTFGPSRVGRLSQDEILTCSRVYHHMWVHLVGPCCSCAGESALAAAQHSPVLEIHGLAKPASILGDPNTRLLAQKVSDPWIAAK